MTSVFPLPIFTRKKMTSVGQKNFRLPDQQTGPHGLTIIGRGQVGATYPISRSQGKATVTAPVESTLPPYPGSPSLAWNCPGQS